MCECGAEIKMKNERIRRQMTKSSCYTMMAMKSDRNGRCDSVFAHSERLISVPHWHTDFFLQENAKTKKNKSHVAAMEPKQRKRNNQTKHQLVMPNKASKNNHDRRCKSVCVCVELLF